MASEKHGSVNLLADAIRQVRGEALEKTADPVQNERTVTTNEDVQARLAQHREDVAADIREALKSD